MLSLAALLTSTLLVLPGVAEALPIGMRASSNATPISARLVPEPRFRGPFVIAQSPSQGELGPFTGDFDNNGRLDLMLVGSVLPRPGLTITASFVFLNTDGERPRRKISVLDKGPDNTAIGLFTPGDVTGDGIQDIVGVFVQFTPFLKNLVVYVGNGDGTFDGPVTASPQLDHRDAFFPLELGDVNEDGALDVVAQFQDQISVLLGKGDGTFAAPIHSGISSAGHSVTLIADFTGDGAPDLVVAIVTGGSDFSSSDIYLQRGNEDGTFQSIQKQTVDTNINGGVVRDFNGDGLPDVAMIGDGGSNGGRAGLWVFLNDGGVLGPGVYYPRGQGGIGAADLNLDGALDLVTSNLLISLNDGAGRFDQVVQLPGGTGVAAVDDFTQDAKPDIVSIRHSSRVDVFDVLLYLNVTPVE